MRYVKGHQDQFLAVLICLRKRHSSRMYTRQNVILLVDGVIQEIANAVQFLTCNDFPSIQGRQLVVADF